MRKLAAALVTAAITTPFAGAAIARPKAKAANSKQTTNSTTATTAEPRTFSKKDSPGTARAAKGMPQLRAEQALSEAAVAKILDVELTKLKVKYVLTPAEPLMGTAKMWFYCAKYVNPDPPRATFQPADSSASRCKYPSTKITFAVSAGRRYLIDCAGKGKDDKPIGWKFSHYGAQWTLAKLSPTQHPAFVFEANETATVHLELEGTSANDYEVHRCEITTVDD